MLYYTPVVFSLRKRINYLIVKTIIGKIARIKINKAKATFTGRKVYLNDLGRYNVLFGFYLLKVQNQSHVKVLYRLLL
jgi:hypothetical protein